VVSEKLDGMRAIWDGGISRGLPASQIPYAALSPSNEGRIATGLWSRLGNIIAAPNEWLDQLPPIACDGELFSHDLDRQELFSVVRKHNGPMYNGTLCSWAHVEYFVFDTVPLLQWWASRSVGQIRINGFECVEWFKRIDRPEGYILVPSNATWIERFKLARDNESARMTPHNHYDASNTTSLFDIVKDSGGEGLILRNTTMGYELKRSSNLLKVKDIHDAEAIIVGHTAGKGKHDGRLGAYIVRSESGAVFNLSGMDDAERENPHPIGSRVRYFYRGISRDGVPQEARIAGLISEQ
jgi:DNA ligase-1